MKKCPRCFDPGLPVDDLPGVFIELLTLLHAGALAEDEQPVVERIQELAPIDAGVLLRSSIGVVLGCLCSVSLERDIPVERLIQELALDLASRHYDE